MSRVISLVSVLLCASSLLAAPAVHLADGKIVVTGISSAKGLSVVVAEGTEADIAARPAMSGEWAEAAGKLTFTPKYPLRPGTKYRVVGTGRGLDIVCPKAAPGKPTLVTGFHPSATELPENVFRFYVEFNQPMPRGESYKYVEVLTDKGDKVEWPFLQQDDELWNARSDAAHVVHRSGPDQEGGEAAHRPRAGVHGQEQVHSRGQRQMADARWRDAWNGRSPADHDHDGRRTRASTRRRGSCAARRARPRR